LDAEAWVPMRWPCGPLAVGHITKRDRATAADVDVLRRWCEPAALEILTGTPVSALVVPWAEGSPADAEQPRELAALVAAAASRRRAVIGWVAEPADLGKAAAAASAAGLAALATEATGPIAGFPVLRFRKRSLDALATPAFLGDAEAVWPGMRPLKQDAGADVDAVSGATSRPWIDSNAWYVRLVRAVLGPKAVWLAGEPPDDGRPVAADAYLQALVDAAAGGGRWLLSLDGALRRGLGEGRADAREAWARIAQGLAFFERHAAWRDYHPAGQIGVVSDFAGANEFLSHEILNLLARRSALYSAIGKDRASAAAFEGLDAVLYVDETPPSKELSATLDAFVDAGGTLIAPPRWKASGVADARAVNPRFEVFSRGKGRVAVARTPVDDPERLAEDAELLVSHRHDRVRVFNLGVGQYHHATSADGRAGVLHLVSYPSPYPAQPLAAWFRRAWGSGRVWRVDGGDATPAARVASGAGVEFHLPAMPAYCALEVAG
jgi:hypothetical protein